MEAYCLKDKQKVQILDAEPIVMRNGRSAMVGKCPLCGGKIYKIGKTS